MELIAKDITKYFGDKKIFNGISLEVSSGHSLVITGPNGSGKTTLIRILCHLLNPTAGKVDLKDSGTEITGKEFYRRIGLVGPYLELYQELTAMENLLFFAKLRQMKDPIPKLKNLLEKFRLAGRENDAVKTYSSGMKQRLKYIFALMNDPEILFLDEPTSNLDSEGIDTVYQVMREQKQEKILILATNEENDLKFGDKRYAIIN